MSRLILLAATAALAGCATTPDAACLADFDAFFARFGEDPAFQREFTAPTVVTTEANAGGTPETIIARKPRAELRFPILPNERARRAEGLALETNAQGGRTAVTIGLPDSDAFVVTYVFERRGCWSLVRVEDHSL